MPALIPPPEPSPKGSVGSRQSSTMSGAHDLHSPTSVASRQHSHRAETPGVPYLESLELSSNRNLSSSSCPGEPTIQCTTTRESGVETHSGARSSQEPAPREFVPPSARERRNSIPYSLSQDNGVWGVRPRRHSIEFSAACAVQPDGRDSRLLVAQGEAQPHSRPPPISVAPGSQYFVNTTKWYNKVRDPLPGRPML